MIFTSLQNSEPYFLIFTRITNQKTQAIRVRKLTQNRGKFNFNDIICYTSLVQVSHIRELSLGYSLFEQPRMKVRVMLVRKRFTGRAIGPKEPVEAEEPLSQEAIF